MAQVTCKECVFLVENPEQTGPARYICRKALQMYPNFSRRFHTARSMRDGACGKEGNLFVAIVVDPSETNPLKVG